MDLKLYFVSLICLLTGITAAKDDEFIYNGFQRSELYVDGLAQITPNGLLRLTNTTKNQQGHAFHKAPLRFKNTSDGNVYSFSACFVFGIASEHPSVGANGLAFVLSPTRGLPTGLPNQFLGLFNPTTDGNSSNHVLAIEFDTILNPELGDINDNHVGIDVNGLRSKNATTASYFVETIGKFKNLSLISGEPMLAWVDYSNPDKTLNVTISPIDVPKPSRPLLSSFTNLSSVISDTMYVGFSSSTGSILTSHYVLGWSFKMNGQAVALNLSSLPSLPSKQNRKKSTTLIIWLSSVVVVLITTTALAKGSHFFSFLITLDSRIWTQDAFPPSQWGNWTLPLH